MILSACIVFFSEPVKPVARPHNLPTDAFWQGGPDGGWWYSCKNKKQDFEFFCIVYGEDGNTLIEDDFELYISDVNKYVPMKEFYKQAYIPKDYVSDYNGIDKIYMQGTLFLKSKNYTIDNPPPQ